MSNGIVPPPVITEQLLQSLLDSASAQSYRASGAGNFNAQYQTILSRFDRFGYNMSIENHEVTGLTFITRPKLNLAMQSVRQDRVLATIDTLDARSLAFALRCYLDTKFAHDITAPPAGKGSVTTNTHLSSQSPFFNDSTPFIVPLTNLITSQSGWPDYIIDTETTPGGFFSEDMTFAKGSDRLNKTYDFTLTFRDIQGGFIMAIFLLWTRFIDLVTRGEVMAYNEDIAARRLCYTCSIYRFVLDPSRQFITKWAKATGCYPISVPIGSVFNVGERESFISAAARIAIPFKVNKVEYMDPIILRDFNAIVTRFSPNVASLKNVANLPQYNFTGIPWINTTQGLNQLQFMAQAQELQDPSSSLVNQVTNAISNLFGNHTPGATAPANPSTLNNSNLPQISSI